MPNYDYLCTDGHRFEVVQRFSDEAITICEVCGKPVQRVLHAPAVHYKGKGFYATDYGRRKGNGDKPESGGPSESESGKKETADSSSSSSGSDGGSDSGSKSDSKTSDSKSADAKGSDSKSSGGESSSSRKTGSSKPAA